MFYRDFRRPKRAKVKVFLVLGLTRWANCGAFGAVFLGALGAYLGAGRGFPGASAQVVHYPTKIASFLSFGAIAFLRSFQISVLRAF